MESTVPEYSVNLCAIKGPLQIDLFQYFKRLWSKGNEKIEQEEQKEEKDSKDGNVFLRYGSTTKLPDQDDYENGAGSAVESEKHKGEIDKEISQLEGQKEEKESKDGNVFLRYGSTTKMPDQDDYENGAGSAVESEKHKGEIEQEISQLESARKSCERGKPWRACLKYLLFIACFFAFLGNSGIQAEPNCVEVPSVSVVKYKILGNSQNCSNHGIHLDCDKNQIMACLTVYGTDFLAVGCAENICINGNGSCPVWSDGEHGAHVLQYKEGECGTSCPGHYPLSDVNKYPVCQERRNVPERNLGNEKSSSPSTILMMICMTFVIFIY